VFSSVNYYLSLFLRLATKQRRIILQTSYANILWHCVMPKVQQSTSIRLKSFVSVFKDTFTFDGHILFCVLCDNIFLIFFLMHIIMILESYLHAYLCIFYSYKSLSLLIINASARRENQFSNNSPYFITNTIADVIDILS
jgi:hypothetical protein